MGSCCASVGRAVASDTRDPRFKSRHRQIVIHKLYSRKDENKEREAGNGPSLKKPLSDRTLNTLQFETHRLLATTSHSPQV